VEIKRHRQLYSVERSQGSVNGVHSLETCSRLQVLLFKGRPNNWSISGDVSPKTTQSDTPACEIKNPSANLYRQDRFEFHQ
jgi:hypothetical protein